MSEILLISFRNSNTKNHECSSNILFENLRIIFIFFSAKVGNHFKEKYMSQEHCRHCLVCSIQHYQNKIKYTKVIF